MAMPFLSPPLSSPGALGSPGFPPQGPRTAVPTSELLRTKVPPSQGLPEPPPTESPWKPQVHVAEEGPRKMA